MNNRRPQLTRAQLIHLLPRGLRPRMAADQVRDLAITHWSNIDLIARGLADERTLFDVLGSTFTWGHVAAELGCEVDLMTEVTHMATAIVHRYGRTGRVGFTGPEYQLAKLAAQAMDRLAAQVDHATAIVAAEISERRLAQVMVEAALLARANAADAAGSAPSSSLVEKREDDHA